MQKLDVDKWLKVRILLWSKCIAIFAHCNTYNEEYRSHRPQNLYLSNPIQHNYQTPNFQKKKRSGTVNNTEMGLLHTQKSNSRKLTSMKSARAGIYPAISLDSCESNEGLGGSSVAEKHITHNLKLPLNKKTFLKLSSCLFVIYHRKNCKPVWLL